MDACGAGMCNASRMTMTRTATGVVALVVAALAMAACGDDDAGGSGEADDVIGTVWSLDQLAGEPVPAGAEVTLEFDGEMVFGNGGCNQYNSAATFDDGVVTIAPEIVSTRMACVGPGGDIEFEYLAALPLSSGFVVDDGTLTITDSDDDVLLVYTASD